MNDSTVSTTPDASKLKEKGITITSFDTIVKDLKTKKKTMRYIPMSLVMKAANVDEDFNNFILNTLLDHDYNWSGGNVLSPFKAANLIACLEHATEIRECIDQNRRRDQAFHNFRMIMRKLKDTYIDLET
jgi:hypothetical protein